MVGWEEADGGSKGGSACHLGTRASWETLKPLVFVMKQFTLKLRSLKQQPFMITYGYVGDLGGFLFS